VILRHRHLLLRILKLRIVVDGHDIYECREKEPAIIPCNRNVTRIVVTNGFHISRVVSVKAKPGIHFYEVESYIDNIQLLSGLFLTLFFFNIYIFTGIRFFMLAANLPILIVLFIFYIKRKTLIQVHLLKTQQQVS
jgi:hypothetical protein